MEGRTVAQPANKKRREIPPLDSSTISEQDAQKQSFGRGKNNRAGAAAARALHARNIYEERCERRTIPDWWDDASGLLISKSQDDLEASRVICDSSTECIERSHQEEEKVFEEELEFFRTFKILEKDQETRNRHCPKQHKTAAAPATQQPSSKSKKTKQQGSEKDSEYFGIFRSPADDLKPPGNRRCHGSADATLRPRSCSSSPIEMFYILGMGPGLFVLILIYSFAVFGCVVYGRSNGMPAVLGIGVITGLLTLALLLWPLKPAKEGVAVEQNVNLRALPNSSNLPSAMNRLFVVFLSVGIVCAAVPEFRQRYFRYHNSYPELLRLPEELEYGFDKRSSDPEFGEISLPIYELTVTKRAFNPDTMHSMDKFSFGLGKRSVHGFYP
ncbi:unnamed protein product [Caenorhabditis auriculariae]|uniref:Uncharacterized protein n=1 Tax=Caenorhabditis auriculariae TaxID=2777116 RepID=A0A8S1H5Q1_9PELO|nr:unnamed protein product [Caenorhabditis auriculariae]